MQLDRYKIKDDQLIEQAIELIEMNSSRCVLVVNQSNKAIGIVSEGDILRAILKGVSIKSPVKHIMNPGFKYITSKVDEQLVALFKAGITLIPVLNNDHELVDVVELISYYNSLNDQSRFKKTEL